MTTKSKQSFKVVLLSLFLCSLFFTLTFGDSKNLVASLAALPGLADSPEKGAFVDLVKAMDNVYDGKIKIGVYPFARSVDNAMKGRADFHIPSIRNPNIPASKIPYRFVKEKMGDVRIVIYSHIDKPVTKKDLNNFIAGKAGSRLKIELPAGLEPNFPFSAKSSNDVLLSLKKVQKKRIDAYVMAQEEADLTIRKYKMKTIHRDFWMSFDDVIIIPKGPKGDRVDKILTKALKKLKRAGRLQKLYPKIHRPYEKWQPSQMGW